LLGHRLIRHRRRAEALLGHRLIRPGAEGLLGRVLVRPGVVCRRHGKSLADSGGHGYRENRLGTPHWAGGVSCPSARFWPVSTDSGYLPAAVQDEPQKTPAPSPPCPCPTRLRRARRWRADRRSGEAASCAAATASRPSRAKRRRPRDRRGHPVHRSSADRATSALRREISPEGPGFSSEYGPVRLLGDTSGASVTRLPPRSTDPEGFCTDYGPNFQIQTTLAFTDCGQVNGVIY
jgi:hypothetical protein